MATLTYLEREEDNATTNFGFDITGGTAKATYTLKVKDTTDLLLALKDILGYTIPFAQGIVAMDRRIPCTHPKFPFMYATKITSLLGMGSGQQDNILEPATFPVDASMGANPITEKYKLYGLYEIGVEFSSRPYPVLQNFAAYGPNGAGYILGSWFPTDGGFSTGGLPEQFYYAQEWVRFTDYDLVPQQNTIQGTQGSLYLVNNTAAININSGLIPFTSPQWIYLPDQMLKVIWYQVPYRYITSPKSYIANRGWVGRINQNKWWNWKAGELLFLNYSVKKYSPPTGDIERALDNSTINYARLCDIEMSFLLTKRDIAVPIAPGTITNGNYIPAGHNLLPDFNTYKFLYAQRSDVGIQGRPAWLSFPMEVLFSDPDAGGGPMQP